VRYVGTDDAYQPSRGASRDHPGISQPELGPGSTAPPEWRGFGCCCRPLLQSRPRDPHPAPAEASLERFDPLAAFASYAIPGLGQLLQGRTAKGILFMVCLPLLFYYGLFLGSFSNVYMVRHPSIVQSLYARPVFAAQFFIGVPAWPAIYEYARARSEMRQPIPGEGGERGRQLFGYGADLGEAKLNDLQRAADKRWDLGWVCTLIAGVLNILVIYDAFAGPAVTHPPPRPQPKPTPDSPTTSESMP
jgi:hypothetical protein